MKFRPFTGMQHQSIFQISQPEFIIMVTMATKDA